MMMRYYFLILYLLIGFYATGQVRMPLRLDEVYFFPDNSGKNVVRSIRNEHILLQEDSVKNVSLRKKGSESRLEKLYARVDTCFKHPFVVVLQENEKKLNPIIGYQKRGKECFITGDGKRYRNIRHLIRRRYGSFQRYTELYDMYQELKVLGITETGGMKLLCRSHLSRELHSALKKTPEFVFVRDSISSYEVIDYRCDRVVLEDKYGEKTLCRLRNLENLYFFVLIFKDECYDF